jgi:hypothetical protein
VFSVWRRGEINISHGFFTYSIGIDLNLDRDPGFATIRNFAPLIFDQIVFICEKFIINVIIICYQGNAFQTILHIA